MESTSFTSSQASLNKQLTDSSSEQPIEVHTLTDREGSTGELYKKIRQKYPGAALSPTDVEQALSLTDLILSHSNPTDGTLTSRSGSSWTDSGWMATAYVDEMGKVYTFLLPKGRIKQILGRGQFKLARLAIRLIEKGGKINTHWVDVVTHHAIDASRNEYGMIHFIESPFIQESLFEFDYNGHKIVEERGVNDIHYGFYGKLSSVQRMAKGTLEDLLDNQTGKQLTLKKSFFIMKQLAYAVEVVHKADITHRDIKPANILVYPGNKIKLNDFGLSRWNVYIKPGDAMGTPTYLPLFEIRAIGVHNYKQTSNTDIFGLGKTYIDILRETTLNTKIKKLLTQAGLGNLTNLTYGELLRLTKRNNTIKQLVVAAGLGDLRNLINQMVSQRLVGDHDANRPNIKQVIEVVEGIDQ